MTLAVLAGAAAFGLLSMGGDDGGEPTSMAGVTVADDVLEQGEPWIEDGEVTGRTTSPAFLISPANSQAAIDAVQAAATRFYSINEFGQEVSEDDPGYYDYDTPSYVSAYRTTAGVALLADTHGDFPLAQGETMVAVLTEELTARDVTAHIDAFPQGLELGDDITS